MKHIFIHGLGQDPTSWEKTIKDMKVQTNSVCPDLSEMLQGKDVNYSNLYHAFSEYCDTLSDSLNLCGLSLGGILALHYAIDHPSRVKSLVLIGTQYIMPRTLLTIQNMIFRFMPNSMFEQMGFEKSDFIELSKSMMKLDFSQELKKISSPVLVICGEKDSANRRASEELAECLSKAEIRIIENAGHEINIDAPEQLAEILNSYYF